MAEVHQRLENCRKTPICHSAQTSSEPRIQIWASSNDLAKSRRSEPPAPQVPDCQPAVASPLATGGALWHYCPGHEAGSETSKDSGWTPGRVPAHCLYAALV